jgi:hypothetical protein
MEIFSWNFTWPHMRRFLILFCWLGNYQKSLANLGQSFFQHPVRAVDFRLLLDSLISTTQSCALQFPGFSDTNNDLHLLALKTPQEMQRLMTPEEHYDALDEWLQE